MENLLNLIFPPKCLFCGSGDGIFCENCLRGCNPAENPSTDMISLFIYEGFVRKCIQKSKYSSRQFQALKELTCYGLKMFAEHRYNGLYRDYLVVPIPLSKHKSRQRGFNQADLIAVEVARCFGLKKEDSILRRTKETKSQFGLTRAQRYKNLSQAFEVPKHLVPRTKNSSVLLVDDICTSGATFVAASEALYGTGVKKVRCFSLAKALYNK